MDSVCRRYILGRRVGQSMVCCTGIQLIVVLATLIPLTMNAWQPSLWLRNIMDVLLYGIGYTIPLSVILCVLCLINSEDIEGEKKLHSSRFASICNIFSVRNIVMGCFYTVIGGFFSYLYVSLIGGEYGKLITNCAGYRCLLESHMYLILCGLWMGQIHFLKTHIFGSQIMVYFVIRQSKLRQIKSELKPLMKRAFSQALWPTLLFALIYYFKGDSTRDKFCEIFYMKFEDDPLSARLFNVTLIIYSWFLATIFFASLSTAKLILQVFVTDHHTFPITKSLGNPNCITLHQALCMKTLPTIQYLGYHDLMVLSAKDSKRREELFSLSQPGGHPHNWNMIIEECLQFINSFTAELTLAIGNTSTEPFSNLTKPAIVHQPTTTLSPPQSHVGMRNLSIAHPAVGHFSTTAPLQEHKLVKIIETKVNSVKESFSKNVAINHVFGELPDSKIKHTFSKSQPMIWASQSLALLAAASFHEDQYGVVQKDLPAIISALLQLKQVLDKLQKISSYKKSPRNEHHNMKLRHAIRSAVKRSLYRITVTFGNHLQELPLPKETMSQIQNFIINRE